MLRETTDKLTQIARDIEQSSIFGLVGDSEAKQRLTSVQTNLVNGVDSACKDAGEKLNRDLTVPDNKRLVGSKKRRNSANNVSSSVSRTPASSQPHAREVLRPKDC